jgi:LysR family glycine cleavage system transcriptional activator
LLDPPRPRLPPLNALRAFEAAARCGGFVTAAAELGVTPGAVAQQVKRLESWLGRVLFERHAQGIILTKAAREVLPALSDALDRLGRAAAELAGDATPRLRIAALPAVAQLWLAPRLKLLRRQFPGIEVSVTALETPPELTRGAFEASLFIAEDAAARPSALRIAADAIAPVCSPALLAGPDALREPADLARAPLLHDTSWREDWQRWRAAAAPELRINPYKGPSFSLYSLVIEAALDGAGVAIGHLPLIEALLRSGRLVAPFGPFLPETRSLYMMMPLQARPSDFLLVLSQSR